MTDKGFRTLYSTIEAGCGRDLSERERDFWRLMLGEEDDARIMARLRDFYRGPEAGKRKERIPTPGDLLEQSEGIEMLAWSCVLKAIRHHGPHKSIAFSDPFIHVVIEAMGGWVKLASVETEDTPFRAREFQSLYRAHSRNGVGLRVSEHLPGIYEFENLANGQPLTATPLKHVEVPYKPQRAFPVAERRELGGV